MSIQNKFPAARPTFFQDFVNSQAVHPAMTVARASAATVLDYSGNIKTIPANSPRIHYNPVTRACLGLLVESSGTNELLNSASLASQNVVVTAQTRTLSFYGTGTVQLSGAYTGTLTSSQAFPHRSVLTFTPTAGTLVVTVDSPVAYAQLEVGQFATSYIPSTTAQATRASEEVTMYDLTPFFNSKEGTLVVSGYSFGNMGTDSSWASMTNGTSSNQMAIRGLASTGKLNNLVRNSSNIIYSNDLDFESGKLYKRALAYSDDVVSFTNGVKDSAAISISDAVRPTLNRLGIGGRFSGQHAINGCVQYVAYYPAKFSEEILAALTK